MHSEKKTGPLVPKGGWCLWPEMFPSEQCCLPTSPFQIKINHFQALLLLVSEVSCSQRLSWKCFCFPFVTTKVAATKIFLCPASCRRISRGKRNRNSCKVWKPAESVLSHLSAVPQNTHCCAARSISCSLTLSLGMKTCRFLSVGKVLCAKRRRKRFITFFYFKIGLSVRIPQRVSIDN